LGPLLDVAFIKPAIRGKADSYPVEYNKYPPFALEDMTVGGSWAALAPFKAMVWRSLAEMRDTRLRYDYVDAYRLVDIQFERDETYGSVRSLSDLDLLIFVLGLADVPNKMLPSLICQVLMLRKDAGRPTWVFSPFNRARVLDVYGSSVVDLVGDVLPVVGGTFRLDTPASIRVPSGASAFSDMLNIK
jgi:hypothetical protein